mmetsp:Transcript_23065/g.87224  ORF Transcript_23065/g.87224 Transcript_23065/m.87224 type:complete len:341 (+) Transcript_23065:612-1634(+)
MVPIRAFAKTILEVRSARTTPRSGSESSSSKWRRAFSSHSSTDSGLRPVMLWSRRPLQSRGVGNAPPLDAPTMGVWGSTPPTSGVSEPSAGEPRVPGSAAPRTARARRAGRPGGRPPGLADGSTLPAAAAKLLAVWMESLAIPTMSLLEPAWGPSAGDRDGREASSSVCVRRVPESGIITGQPPPPRLALPVPRVVGRPDPAPLLSSSPPFPDFCDVARSMPESLDDLASRSNSSAFFRTTILAVKRRLYRGRPTSRPSASSSSSRCAAAAAADSVGLPPFPAADDRSTPVPCVLSISAGGASLMSSRIPIIRPSALTAGTLRGALPSTVAVPVDMNRRR